jgi:uncharacterized protein YggE
METPQIDRERKAKKPFLGIFDELKHSHKILLFLIVISLGIFLLRNFQISTTNVIGQGSVQARPEKAQLTVSWVSKGNSAAEAVENQRNLANSLIRVVKSFGAGDEDIVVTYPQVVASSQVYQAVNAMDVSLKKTENLDELIASLYSNGARSVSNISLSTSRADELEAEAMDRAYDDAKQKAQRIARSSGLALGRIVSINSNVSGQATARSARLGAKKEEGDSNGASAPEQYLQTSGEGSGNSSQRRQIEITRNVSVVYRLRPSLIGSLRKIFNF